MVDNTSASSFENPCDLVRKTCRAWMKDEGLVVMDDGDDLQKDSQTGRRSVRIRIDKLLELADEIAMEAETTKSTKLLEKGRPDSTTEENASWIQWDEEGWHYNGEGFEGTETEKRERVALYLLALDAINFCFWPLPGSYGKTTSTENTASSTNQLEYDHLAMAMKKMAEADHGRNNVGYVFSPENLASLNDSKMTSLFESYLDPLKYPLPDIRKRSMLWKELGEVLLADFHGSASALLDASDKNASKLVELVASSFPGFRDQVHISSSASQQQQRIVFLKRAQIFVGDANAALRLNLGGMDKLTTFADYRVPQILRHKGVLEYSSNLALRVNQERELEKGSFDEISIRASTVVAVEELVKFLNQSPKTTQKSFTDVTVDWYLWQVGERMHQEGMMKPFHRVRTHFY